jgi:transcriptional regulator with PAS, ATPase and Fis domain
VRDEKFRDDLFFRLNVVRITMPPLRDRKEDIPILVRGFLRHFCEANDKPLVDLAPDAMDALLTYNWPGNVSAASKRVMPRSNALCISAIASPSVKFPHQPVEIVQISNPTSPTVRSVFLYVLKRMCDQLSE